MTSAERQKRHRDKRRRERDAAPEAKRDRRRKRWRDGKRRQRAGERAEDAADLTTTAPAMPVADLVAWCGQSADHNAR